MSVKGNRHRNPSVHPGVCQPGPPCHTHPTRPSKQRPCQWGTRPPAQGKLLTPQLSISPKGGKGTLPQRHSQKPRGAGGCRTGAGEESAGPHSTVLRSYRLPGAAHLPGHTAPPPLPANLFPTVRKQKTRSSPPRLHISSENEYKTPQGGDLKRNPETRMEAKALSHVVTEEHSRPGQGRPGQGQGRLGQGHPG